MAHTNQYSKEEFNLILNNQVALYKSTGQAFTLIVFKLDPQAEAAGIISTNQLNNAIRLPNEVEDVITQMPGVLECAAVGVPDEKAGEAVKVVIVKKDPAITEADVRAFCEANLTGYKRPKLVEFRTDLPKTPVGKILRRELRG